MCFLRDEAARRRRGGLPGRGARAARLARRPGRPLSARRDRARDDAADPAARARAGRRRRGRAARLPRPPARRAAGGAYVASLSFRTVTYKALCAADAARGVLSRPARPGLEVAVRRSSTSGSPRTPRRLGARAAVPVPLSQRRDQHDPGQRELDASPRGDFGLDAELSPGARRARLRLGHARQRASTSRPRRPRHPPRALAARPAGLGEDRGSPTRSARLLPLPRGPDRAVGRSGRPRLHRRPRRRRGARPQRPAAAAFAVCDDGLVAVAPRPAPSRAGGRASAAGSSARAR